MKYSGFATVPLLPIIGMKNWRTVSTPYEPIAIIGNNAKEWQRNMVVALLPKKANFLTSVFDCRIAAEKNTASYLNLSSFYSNHSLLM
jgi:hypothetical protein